MGWLLKFTRGSPSCARFLSISLFFCSVTRSKCRVILKSIYPDVALCETHRISYREWKEEDWSLRFVREGVQNAHLLVLHVVFGP